ncbi:Uncharacterised protein [Serratia fonticola]|nr:Uncharacterised protein [Serratia fonticola]CAI0759076.1 Uncharacterised protein [Serratia fonticola]CAI1590259.1 Uncharacterised protein [Serratia fonticola]
MILAMEIAPATKVNQQVIMKDHDTFSPLDRFPLPVGEG